METLTKKNLFLFFSFFIFIALPAQAADKCGWQDMYTITTGQYMAITATKTINDCEDRNLITSDEKNCTATKPNYANKIGEIHEATCCCPKTTNSASAKVTNAIFSIPDFQVKIPGLDKLATITCPIGEECTIPWIGQYIKGVYNYALAIVGIIAAIILMAGGLMWIISAGDASKITQAKELIIGSISGLIILICSYSVLLWINPDLVNLKPVKVASIAPIEIEGDNDSPPVQLDITKISSILGTNCGKDSISDIVNKAKGKITYNMKLRNTSAPGILLYLDCSSFVNFVSTCATGKSTGQNTSAIFKDQQLWDQSLNSLKPGDLVGWTAANSASSKKVGHVFIYMGNGTFADCHGGKTHPVGGCVGNSTGLASIVATGEAYTNGKLYFKRY